MRSGNRRYFNFVILAAAVFCSDYVLATVPASAEPALSKGASNVPAGGTVSVRQDKFKLGEGEEALADTDAALKINPRAIKAWQYRCSIYVNRGESENAVKCLTKLTELVPDKAVNLMCAPITMSKASTTTRPSRTSLTQ